MKETSNKKFACFDCSSTFSQRKELARHHSLEHIGPIDECDMTSDRTDSNLAEDNRQLKSNFERLNSLFQGNLEELDSVKSEYKAKLDEAYERVANITAENESLKERLDILYKLSKEYIDRRERSENVLPVEANDSPRAEEISQDNNQLLTQRSRGFRRKTTRENIESNTLQTNSTSWTPTSPPILASGSNGSSRNGYSNVRGSASTVPEKSVNDRLLDIVYEGQNKVLYQEQNNTSKQYCHYFTNYGSCLYEERSDRQCKFKHQIAPVCSMALTCTRPKCMYTHPNITGRSNSFLGNQSQNHQTSSFQAMQPVNNSNVYPVVAGEGQNRPAVGYNRWENKR